LHHPDNICEASHIGTIYVVVFEAHIDAPWKYFGTFYEPSNNS